MTTPGIRGTVADIDGFPHLVITLAIAAEPNEVWRDLTESERLEKWVGRWEGDPATGSVVFSMTAEGADVEAEEFEITECDRPRRLAGSIRQGGTPRHLWFELAEAEGETTLTFGQRIDDEGADVSSIGPGWEYYLDRMIAVREGAGADSVAWDQYYPALRDAYAALVATG